MIDKNGKIGGKVNLIDLIIVVVILAAVAFVGYRFILKDDTGVINSQPLTIEFISSEVNDYTVEQLRVGDVVLDGYENNYFGNITDIEIGDPSSYTVNDLGDTILMSIPECKSVKLTIDGAGALDENGFVINGTRYAVGHTTVVYAGKCKLYGKISGIDPA